MIRKALAILCLCACAGCYTQFAMIPRNDAGVAPPDSAAAGDSTQSRIQDTVRVSNNQVCYWTRDLTGQPELRCYDSYYGRDWYRYNYYPWWSRSDPYYYGSYNSYGWDQQCPAYYYYDYSCGACRYYRDYQGSSHSWWWNGSRSGGGGSSSAQPASPRRDRSSSLSSSPESRKSVGSSVLNKNISGTSPTAPQTGLSEKPASAAPAERQGRTRGGSLTSHPAEKEQPREDPSVKELPKVQVEPQQPPQQENVPQAPPAVAPPPNPGSDNQDQNNDKPKERPRERRNPRSF
jgi:hypothetical protein